MKFVLCLLFILVFANSNIVGATKVQRYDFNDQGKLATYPLKIAQRAALKQGGVHTKTGMFLSVHGNGKSIQYPLYSKTILINKNSSKIGISINYRVNEKFKSAGGMAMLMLDFLDQHGARVKRVDYRLAVNKTSWYFFAGDTVIPPTAKKIIIYVRMDKISAQNYLDIDNFTVGLFKKNESILPETALFNFEAKERLTPLYDRLNLTSETNIIDDWADAAKDEAFVTASGLSQNFQYPINFTHLRAIAGKRYQVRGFYRYGGNHLTGNAIIYLFFKDSKGKIIGKTHTALTLQKNGWKHFEFMAIAPKKSVSADISLRLLQVPKSCKIQLDALSYEPLPAAAKLNFRIESAERALYVLIKAVGGPGLKDIQHVKFTITACKTNKKKTFAIDANQEKKIDISGFKEGDYYLDAVITLKKGQVLRSNQQKILFVNKMQWANNHLGILKGDAPPPYPWQPIKYNAKNHQFITWNNKFSFSHNLQLQAITELNDQNSALLQAPFEIKLDNKNIFQSLDNAKIIEQNPRRIILESRGIIKLSEHSKLALRLIVDAAYDGFIHYKLYLKSQQNVILKNLNLKINVAHADTLVPIDGSWSYTKIIDLKQQPNYSSKRFIPGFWLGNVERGLAFWTNKIYPAVVDQNHKWVDISSHRSGTGELTLNLINNNLKLTANASRMFQFAISTTPTRPTSNLAHTFRFRAGKYSNADLLWGSPRAFAYFGFPVATAGVDKFVKNYRDKQLFIYQTPSFAMTSIPEWNYFDTIWRSTPERIYPKETSMKVWNHDLVRVDISRKDWQDFYLWHYQQFFKQHPKVKNVYFDCFGTAPQINKQTGEFSYLIFKMRDYAERIYILQRQLNPDSLTIIHSGASGISEVTPFCDLVLTGEHLREKCSKSKYYLEFFSPEVFLRNTRIRIGPTGMFLPQFKGWKINDRKINVHTIGMSMVNDLILYPNFLIRGLVDKARNKLYSFGLDNATAYHWWKHKLPVGLTVTGDNQLATAFENSKGILLILLNSSKEKCKYKINFASSMTKTDKNMHIFVYDPLTGAVDSLSEHGGIVEIDGYMFKMILYSDKLSW